MRSPLAYPLTRPVDGDAGGAADLQTDVMRFMAILSLCLVAIFALVQSLPLAPEPDAHPEPVVQPDPVPRPEPAAPAAAAATRAPPDEPAPLPAAAPRDGTPLLTRSGWTPKFVPAARPLRESAAPEAPAAPPAPASRGFTLAFESDLTLARLVAAGRIRFYAITESGARRMTVNNSRISFWDASTPNSFHEMEAQTVPQAVIGALAGGGTVDDVQWGVTLPADMRRDLDTLLGAHADGDITIHADGRMTLGAEQ